MNRHLETRSPGQGRPTPPAVRQAAGPDAPRALPRRVAALGLLLAAITLAVFWPATGHDFVNYDDSEYVANNPHVTSGLTWQNAWWALRSGYAANWHPVTWLSHMLDCQVFGLKPWGHHLTSVAVHALNAMLVFLLLQQMTRARWRSLCVAALFALHPLRVESVAWVAERKDVLSACFGWLALIFYVRYVQAQRPEPKVQSRTLHVSRFTLHAPHFYLLSLCFYTLGLMSKPMLVTWPFVMLLLDYWPLRRFEPSTLNSQLSAFWRLVREKLPFLALAAAASLATLAVQRGAMADSQGFPLGERSGNALISYCRYLGKMFWPADLAVFYPYHEQRPMPQVLLCGGAMAVVSGLLFAARRRAPFLLMGWLWFCGTLVPVIGLVQVGAQAFADRYSYIPSLGVLILAVWGIYALGGRWHSAPKAMSVAGGVAIAISLALTRSQLQHWHNTEALFRHALVVTENNWLAQYQVGTILHKHGRSDEAISLYLEALRLKPDYAEACYNLGVALVSKGQAGDAMRQFREAIRLKPNYAEARNNLGVLLVSQGEIDEAVSQHQAALRLKPDYPEACYNLGIAFSKKGQTDEAIAQYQQALRLKPDYIDAYNNLGNALLSKGQVEAAINQFRQALRLQPNYVLAHYNLGKALAQNAQWAEAIAHYQQVLAIEPGALAAQYNLAWLLATCPEAAQRNGTKALELAQELDRLSGGKDGDNLDVLAAAFAEAGQFPQAVEAAGRALALAVTQTNLNVETIRARLKLYQNRSPYHESPASQ